jgi:hypothetical protein
MIGKITLELVNLYCKGWDFNYMKFFRWKSKSKKKEEEVNDIQTIEDLINSCKQSDDFVHYTHTTKNNTFEISYFKSIIDSTMIRDDFLKTVNRVDIHSLDELQKLMPIQNSEILSDVKEIHEKLLTGHFIIQIKEKAKECLVIDAPLKMDRNISIPEVEFSVVGPKEAFVESLETNISLLRKRLPIPQLKMKEITVGYLTKTKIGVFYIEGIANKENVNTVIQRIQDIEIDQIIDSSYITQIISDNPRSLFPQLLDTERPDRAASVLTEGKIVIMVSGSPHVLITPTNLTNFFSAFEDYFLNPIIASSFRIIRFFSVIFSILVTSIYVAVLTYHYELVPKDLLGTLVASREVVPFPPILEALFLEIVIELLREAGARLPLKVGQTIGIVGGIVIGTASVQAGLTSNILLIMIALAALAAFTTPVYQMGNTIRLIRFPFLMFAYFFGMLGVVICFCFLLAHMLRLTSLGRPFLEPFFPPRVRDLKDTIIRYPFSHTSLRPVQLQTEKTVRFSGRKARKKKDIDE